MTPSGESEEPPPPEGLQRDDSPSAGFSAAGSAARQNVPRRGNRLGSQERIRRGWEYRQVYDGGTAQHGRAFVLFVLVDPTLDRRAGFVAGRRVGNAVKRNRARRLLREAYRRLKVELPATGCRLVFVARSPCPEQSLSEIDREMRLLLHRARLL